MKVADTANPPATVRHRRWCTVAVPLIAASLLLTGCSVLEKPLRPSVFDFGPGPSAVVAPAGALQTVALAEVEAPAALDSTAILYRFSFSNPHQLLPYAQARWSMAPAQLVRQRLRDVLGQGRSVVGPAEAGLAFNPTGFVLRVELEEFSQIFEAADKSFGMVRLRATLAQATPTGDRLLGQRMFLVQRSAATPDAAGGVRAIAEASTAAAQEIEQWLTQFR